MKTEMFPPCMLFEMMSVIVRSPGRGSGICVYVEMIPWCIHSETRTQKLC